MVKTITIPEIKVMAELITNMKHKRVGILGGTFNPPHLGHLIIAEQVKSQLNLDEVMFIPGVKTVQAKQLNVYDVLNCNIFIMTAAAATVIGEVYGK